MAVGSYIGSNGTTRVTLRILEREREKKLKPSEI